MTPSGRSHWQVLVAAGGLPIVLPPHKVDRREIVRVELCARERKGLAMGEAGTGGASSISRNRLINTGGSDRTSGAKRRRFTRAWRQLISVSALWFGRGPRSCEGTSLLAQGNRRPHHGSLPIRSYRATRLSKFNHAVKKI